MKKSIRLFIAALAVSMTFASCIDNMMPEKAVDDNPTLDGKRIITASFESTTKTTVMETSTGFKPEFVDGDEIFVFDNERGIREKCRIIVHDGVAVFATTLEGNLAALYPASCAVVNGDEVSYSRSNQTGKFADANIAYAEIGEDNEALFENLTPILRFYVDKSIGVKSLKVNYLRDGNGYFIRIDPDGDVTLDEVTDDPGKRICYVALPPQAKIISIESETTTQGTVTKSFNSPTVEAGVIYDAFIPYYIDLDAAGKWAYCNLGAFLPEDEGLSYSWGNIVGSTETEDLNYSSTPGALLTGDIPADAEYDAAVAEWGGNWRIPTIDESTRLNNLTKDYDNEAYIMKFSSDGKELIFRCYSGGARFWSSTYHDATQARSFYFSEHGFNADENVVLQRELKKHIRPIWNVAVTGVTLKTNLLLPLGESETLVATIVPKDATNQAVTWSSSDTSVATVDQTGKVTAVSKGTTTITVTTADGGKTATCDVKVTDSRVLPNGALKCGFTVNANGKKVFFSKGNLVASINNSGKPTAWKFATNQYDCIGEGGANKTIGSNAGDVDLFCWSMTSDLSNWGIHKKTWSTDNVADYYSGEFKDWGTAIDSVGTWRTLSRDEWIYLFNTRTNASKLYKWSVTVCGKKCLVIAPDNWDYTTSPLQSSYDATSWETAQEAGLVCLPAAGERRTEGNKSILYSCNESGYYWSSTDDGNSNVRYMLFNGSGNVDPNNTICRDRGLPVRLVTEGQIPDGSGSTE